METGIRAARDQMAMERIVHAADLLAGRFGIDVDVGAFRRHHPDPARPQRNQQEITKKRKNSPQPEPP